MTSIENFDVYFKHDILLSSIRVLSDEIAENKHTAVMYLNCLSTVPSYNNSVIDKHIFDETPGK